VVAGLFHASSLSRALTQGHGRVQSVENLGHARFALARELGAMGLL
jgi:hypothetical protein